MSNNPFNTSFDTRPSWERGTARDFANAFNAQRGIGSSNRRKGNLSALSPLS